MWFPGDIFCMLTIVQSGLRGFHFSQLLTIAAIFVNAGALCTERVIQYPTFLQYNRHKNVTI